MHLRGVRFRHAANAAQQAAAQFRGRGDIVEDCVFEQANSSGACFQGPDQVVRRCTFQDNGQLGWGANRAHNLLFTGCVTRRNNAKNFDRGWEAGGDKVCLSRGVVIEHSRFEDNHGSGIWFDIGNEDCAVKNCLIAENQDAGIFYEISFGLHAPTTSSSATAWPTRRAPWGASAGICLSSSPGCVVERNLILGNKEGFAFREQSRTTPRIEGASGSREELIGNHDETIRNNIFAANRDAQVWGWWDTGDDRHWPAARRSGNEPGTRACRLSNCTSPSPATCTTLPRASPRSAGASSGNRTRRYATLDEVRRELSLEQGGRIAHFVVKDDLTRDFRVPPDSPALALGAYPRGEVPGVRLGVHEPASTVRRPGSRAVGE